MALTPGRRLLALLFCIPLISVMSTTMIVASTPEIASDFGRGDVGRSLIIATTSGVGFLLAPFLGFIADRFGRRRVITASLIVFGVGGLLGSLAPNYEFFIASRVFLGFGSIGLLGLTITSIADFWNGEDRIKYLGYNAAALSVGLTVQPLLGGVIAQYLGWRWAVAAMSIAIILAGFVAKLLPTARTQQGGTPKEQLKNIAALFSNPIFVLCLCLNVVIFVSIFGAQIVSLPEMLKTEFGMSESARGTVLATGGIAAVTGGILVGRIRQRIRTKHTIYLGTACFAAGNLIVGFADSVPIIYLGALVYGFAEGVGVSTLNELVASIGGIKARASAVMGLIAAARFGQVLGSIGFGYLSSVWSEQSHFVFAGALFCAALIAEIIYAEVRERRA